MLRVRPIGVGGDVAEVEAGQLVVPVPHHLLHTRLPNSPVVLSFEGNQILCVLKQKSETETA